MLLANFASSLLFFAFLHVATCGLTGTINVDKLKIIFNENLKSNDPANFYYSVKGLNLLNIPYQSNICDGVKKLNVDESNIEHVYYISNSAALTKCHQAISPNVLKSATAVLEKKDSTIPEVFYAVRTMKALGKPSAFDKVDGFKTLIQLLKKDESPTNYGYLMQLCTDLECGSWVQTQAADIIAQADEVDGKMLYWEGGLPATATLLTAILKSFSAANKPSPLTQEQSDKFAEYLLFRRSVNTPKGAALLLETAAALSDDKNVSPVVIALKGKNYIGSSTDSVFVTVTDLIGRPIPEQTATLQSATREEDGVVVASKQTLPKKGDAYELQLSDAGPGKYRAVVSAGRASSILNIIVLTNVNIINAGLAIADLDGASQPQYLQLSYPTTHSKSLSADHLHKVSLKFKVVDDMDKTRIVQQAFVRVASVDSGDEVVFIAETDSSNTYKVEMSVSTLSQHFNHLSGSFVIDLYIGDSAITTPLQWRVANIDLKFAEKPKEKPRSVHAALPEITHKFREAEPRPPRLVSDVFALAAASPLLLLLVLWGALKINVADFPFTISALVFHLGLGAILCLLVVFWLQLTMFDTVRYLLGLGLITFVSGHRLLKHLVKINKF